MKGMLLCAVGLMSSLPLLGRVGAPPLSSLRPVQPLTTIQRHILPSTDIQKELATDRQAGGAAPLRFAVLQEVDLTPSKHGTWEPVVDGRLWRLRILSPGATDLNLGFTRFWMPEGATLHVLAENEPYFQGPYVAHDNKPHGQLWTPVVPGNSVVLELFVPAQTQQEPELVLGQVGCGYRDLFHKQKSGPALLGEGTCNIDVACPQAAPWTNEIRSVGLYSINGSQICTGTLIADAAGDFRSYFLTANHCGLTSANASSVVVYWNYQSSNCGTHGPGSLAQNQSGAVFRAAKYDVDFALIEIDEIPDPSFGVFYSGWDRSGAAPASGVGIHHPQTDVKAISFSDNPLTAVKSCIGTGGTATHWQVIWSAGVTEAGSSGSGFWDAASHSLVGTLSGGFSSCSAPTAPDCYGNFAVAWASGTSPASRLRDWLDPENTGLASVPGVDPALVTILIPADSSVLAENCAPANGTIDPGETVTVRLALQNLGGVPTTNLVATLLSTGGIQFPSATQNYGVTVRGAEPVSRTFSFTAIGACGGTITPTLQLQDGTRNLGTAMFGFALGVPSQAAIFSENFDDAVAPYLPAGWTASSSGGTPWASSTAESETTPNAAFAADADFITDNLLTSPPIFITSSNAQLNFRNSYNTESGYDGGILEISIGGSAFNDILAAGGAFVTNGYNQNLSAYYQNPLAGKRAWSGDSVGFVTTVVRLPSAALNQRIQLRWRFGTDTSYGVAGWSVDTVSVTQPIYTCCGSEVPPLIINPRYTSPGTIAFSYDSHPGQTYIVETITDLSASGWTCLQTNLGDGSRQSFTNSDLAPIQRFFRLRVPAVTAP